MLLQNQEEQKRLLQILNKESFTDQELFKSDQVLLELSEEEALELKKEEYQLVDSCSVCGVGIISPLLFQYSSGHCVHPDHVYTRVCSRCPEDKKDQCRNKEAQYKKEYEFPFL